MVMQSYKDLLMGAAIKHNPPLLSALCTRHDIICQLPSWGFESHGLPVANLVLQIGDFGWKPLNFGILRGADGDKQPRNQRT
jgi:hypothetical protein